MASINGIPSIGSIPAAGHTARPLDGAGAKEFGDLFQDAVNRVEDYRIKAEEAGNRFMNGETEEIHQVILAGQRAELAFETFVQVRNKVVQAYQEVMRMQM